MKPAYVTLTNPLKRGYSPETISANIAELQRAGVKRAQAIATSADRGRTAYRKRYPRGPYPAHLREPAKKKPRYVIAKTARPREIAKAGRPRGIRGNPTDDRNMRKAVRLYEDFTGHNPTYTDEWDVDVPDTALQVGHVTGILYKTKMDGKVQEFMHEFSGKSRPILAASADGRQLLLLGGDYKFTERGIVDGSYSIN